MNWYEGKGTKLSARGQALPPAAEPLDKDAQGYLADEELAAAMNVSIALNMPLLVTGEPGTGKTQLARAVAHELELELVEFSAKTTTSAPDLFYRYDALRHFHDSRDPAKPAPANDYIEFQGLGIAIALSDAAKANDKRLPEKYRDKAGRRCLVLIDEVDKAPRDFPNDILLEIERMEFTVPVTGEKFECQGERPIVILTSNLEKNLPDAFLRRCAFHFIEFPKKKLLMEIARRRLKPDVPAEPLLEAQASHFEGVREVPNLMKKPATAEFLQWVRMLGKWGIGDAILKAERPFEHEQAAILARSYGVLLKSKDDIDAVKRAFGWIEQSA